MCVKFKLLFGLLILFFFAQCQQEDLFDASSYQKEYFIQNVPAEFDWSSISSRTFVIRANDKYQGAYFYQFELYNLNPLYSSEALCYGRGVAAGNGECRIDVNLPADLTAVFIKQIAPNGIETVSSCKLSDGIIRFDFSPELISEGESSTSAVSAESSNRTASRRVEAFAVPANAVVIDSHSCSPYMLSPNTNYWIKDSFDGEINFSWDGSNLYVSGQWTSRNANMLIQRNSSLYVLDGGEVIIPQASRWICNQNGSMYIENGAVFNTSNSSLQLTYTNDGVFHNAGRACLTELDFHSCPSFENSGNLKLEKFHSDGYNSSIVNSGTAYVDYYYGNSARMSNTGTWYSKEFITELGTLDNTHSLDFDAAQIKRTTLTNGCSMTLKRIRLEQGHCMLSEGSILEVDTIEFDGADVKLLDGSMLRVKGLFQSSAQSSNFSGVGSHGSLIQAREMVLDGLYASHFNNNLYVECDEVKGLSDTSHAQWAKVGQSDFEIHPNDCNTIGHSGTESAPSDPSFPVESEITAPYTFLMEDNFPSIGDYDMNDLVVMLNSQLLYKNADNKVESVIYRMEVIAIGATRQLGLAVAFDGLSKTDIEGVSFQGIASSERSQFDIDEKGLEKNNSMAVVPLFQSAHALVNVPLTQMVNTFTDGPRYPTVPFEVVVKLSNPVDESKLAVSQLNIFTIVSVKSNGMRTEVHLPGFAQTDKSNVSPLVIQSTQNLMWALLVPGKITISPEYVNFKNTYPRFESWVMSNKKVDADWYLYPSK